MQTIYKILFEVRLLHEFYLTNPDGSSIFGAASAAARDSFLQDYSDRNQRSINSDVDYIVAAQQPFRDNRLKLVRTYSGFKVGIEVTPTADSGKIAYAPVARLSQGLNIPVLLSRTNADFDLYTNRRLRPAFDSLCYFSNGAVTGVKTAPFLTNPVPAQSAGASYEQGELSLANNTVNAFYVDAGGTGQFAAITGRNFLNETDRILVSPEFQYYFEPTDNIKNASFTVTDMSNKTVYSQTVNSATILRSVSIRVDEQQLSTVPATVTGNDFIYNLNVTGNGSYNRTYKLIFLSASLAGANTWGLVNIINQPGNTPFSIIDDKGLLITRRNTDGSVAIAPPVFEIWLKSRYSFWRYINDQGKPLKDSYPSVLKLTAGSLVSLTPQPHTFAPTPVKTKKLPNPKPFYPVKPEGQQIFADIVVPASDIFPLGP
ncbi:MAG: hypothetical protein JST42_14020 [Bacteroidetes bacterium]|nr:hypothetical protein [Bacteroidota bacterium]